MRLTVDTNVLVRAITGDEPRQTAIAQTELRKAEVIAIGTSCLCEVVWVLSRIYKIPSIEIVATLRGLIDSANVVVERVAVEAGLTTLEAGGDFADGAIAIEGKRLGGATFVSFDKRAIRLVKAAGEDARQL